MLRLLQSLPADKLEGLIALSKHAEGPQPQTIPVQIPQAEVIDEPQQSWSYLSQEDEDGGGVNQDVYAIGQKVAIYATEPRVVVAIGRVHSNYSKKRGMNPKKKGWVSVAIDTFVESEVVTKTFKFFHNQEIAERLHNARCHKDITPVYEAKELFLKKPETYQLMVPTTNLGKI